MHYTHDLRARVTVPPSFIISLELGSNVVIVNICIGLPASAWKKKASLEFIFLGTGSLYIQCIFSFCKQRKSSLGRVMLSPW